MPRWLRSLPLVVALRLLLGFVFVFAAVGKIHDPPAFAKQVAAYRMVPPELLNVMALVLPWLELLVGAALIVGVWVRTASLFTTGLLIMFLTAIGLRFARGETNFECGCFPHTPGAIDKLPVIGQLVTFFFTSTDAQVTFARDIVLLAMSLLVVATPLGWRAARPGAGDPKAAA